MVARLGKTGRWIRMLRQMVSSKSPNDDKGGEKPPSMFGVVSHALNGVSVLG
jgi:hypothetical protein